MNNFIQEKHTETGTRHSCGGLAYAGGRCLRCGERVASDAAKFRDATPSEFEVTMTIASAPAPHATPFERLTELVEDIAGRNLSEADLDKLESLTDQCADLGAAEFLRRVLCCAEPSFRVGAVCRAVGLDVRPLRESALQAGISHTLLAKQVVTIERRMRLQRSPL